MNKLKLIICVIAGLSMCLAGYSAIENKRNRIEVSANRCFVVDMRGQGTNDFVDTVVVIDRDGWEYLPNPGADRCPTERENANG